jgi:hypothetical protein
MIAIGDGNLADSYGVNQVASASNRSDQQSSKTYSFYPATLTPPPHNAQAHKGGWLTG